MHTESLILPLINTDFKWEKFRMNDAKVTVREAKRPNGKVETHSFMRPGLRPCLQSINNV